jgi:hypothetical protein
MPHRYLLAALLSTLSGMASFGQATDLELQQVHLSSDFNTIPVGLRSSMAVTVRNADSLALEAGDTVGLNITIDGEWYSHEWVLSAPLMGGEIAYVNFGPGNVHAFDEESSFNDVRAWLHFGADTIAANDTLEAVYQTSFFSTNDWAGIEMEILSPDLDSFDLDNGTNTPPAIDEARVVLKNMGMVTYLQWTPIHYAIILGSDTTMVSAVLADSNIAPAQSTTRYLSNPALFPTLPDSVGNYAICVQATEVIDFNSTNDVACFDFAFVDLYDPNDPTNWPFGIATLEEAPFHLVPQPEGIGLFGVQERFDVALFDLAGHLIQSCVISSDGILQTEVLAPGLYVMHARDAHGQTYVMKVMTP